MPTGVEIMQDAMNHLAVLQPGGTPNSSQRTVMLRYLNAILGELQTMGALGYTETITVSGRNIVKSVTNAGVWTTTDTGGVESRVVTPVVVTTYAVDSTNNTYPVGWDAYLPLALAVRFAGSVGVGVDRIAPLQGQAQAALQEILPKETAKPTGQEKAG